MATQTQKIYLHMVCRPNDAPYFVITDSDMSSIAEYTVVAHKDITFSLPEVGDCVPLVVKGLQETREKMKATASAAIAEVDSQIASLLAIEHQEAGE